MLILTKVFLALSVLSFPFQVRTLVYTPQLFPGGNFDPFSAFFVSLHTILVFVSALCYGVYLLFQNNHSKENAVQEKSLMYRPVMFFWSVFFFVGIILLVFNIIPDQYGFSFQVHFYQLLQWFVLFLWFVLLSSNILPLSHVVFLFCATLSFQALISLVQFFLQSPVGLSKLGEVDLRSTTLGIAKVDGLGGKIVRAYGTFPHANILGGALVFGLFSALYLFSKRKFFLPTIVLFVSALLCTFSRSSWLAVSVSLVLTLFLARFPKKLFIYLLSGFTVFASIILIFQGPLFERITVGDPKATEERLEYVAISKEMLMQYPFGVGLGGFTHMMPQFSSQKLSPWLLQPVHNVVLLMANELGFLGVINFIFLLFAIFVFFKKEYSRSHKFQKYNALYYYRFALFVSFLVISFFDHYFMSLEQGQFLFIFLLYILCCTPKDQSVVEKLDS